MESEYPARPEPNVAWYDGFNPTHVLAYFLRGGSILRSKEAPVENVLVVSTVEPEPVIHTPEPTFFEKHLPMIRFLLVSKLGLSTFEQLSDSGDVAGIREVLHQSVFKLDQLMITLAREGMSSDGLISALRLQTKIATAEYNLVQLGESTNLIGTGIPYVESYLLPEESLALPWYMKLFGQTKLERHESALRAKLSRNNNLIRYLEAVEKMKEVKLSGMELEIHEAKMKYMSRMITGNRENMLNHIIDLELKPLVIKKAVLAAKSAYFGELKIEVKKIFTNPIASFRLAIKASKEGQYIKIVKNISKGLFLDGPVQIGRVLWDLVLGSSSIEKQNIQVAVGYLEQLKLQHAK